VTCFCRWPNDEKLKLFLGNTTSEIWDYNVDLATFKNELAASKKLNKTYEEDKSPIINVIFSNGFLSYVSEKKVYFSFYDKDKNDLFPGISISIPQILKT